jgi:hypothetical protein
LLAVPIGLLALLSYAVNRVAAKTHLSSAGADTYSSAFMVFWPAGWSRLPTFEREDTGFWARNRADHRGARDAAFAAQNG